MTELTPGSRRKLLRHIREGFTVLELAKEMGLWRRTVNKLINDDIEIGDEFDFSHSARKARMRRKQQFKIDTAKDRITDNELRKMRILEIREATSSFKSGKDIMEHWAAIHDLKVADLTGSSRNSYISEVRQMAMYEIRRQLQYSLPQIGRMFGGRDHTTVLHAFNKICAKANNGPAQPLEPIAGTVLQKLANGGTAESIARSLGMKRQTVKTMVAAIGRAA